MSVQSSQSYGPKRRRDIHQLEWKPSRVTEVAHSSGADSRGNTKSELFLLVEVGSLTVWSRMEASTCMLTNKDVTVIDCTTMDLL